jgi:hypothetical protein
LPQTCREFRFDAEHQLLVGLLRPVDDWRCLRQGAKQMDIIRKTEEGLILRGVLHRDHSCCERPRSAGAWGDPDRDDAVSRGLAVDGVNLPEDDNIGIGDAIRRTGACDASTLTEFSGGQRHLPGDHRDREVSDGWVSLQPVLQSWSG